MANETGKDKLLLVNEEEYGNLNQIALNPDEQVVFELGDNESMFQKIKDTLRQSMRPNAFGGKTRWKAVVLDIDDQILTPDAVNAQGTGLQALWTKAIDARAQARPWWKIFGSAAGTSLFTARIRIPEVHAPLPTPIGLISAWAKGSINPKLKLGTQRLVSMHPKAIAASTSANALITDIPIPLPGSTVWVEFEKGPADGRLINPVIVGVETFSQEGYYGELTTAKGSFDIPEGGVRGLNPPLPPYDGTPATRGTEDAPPECSDTPPPTQTDPAPPIEDHYNNGTPTPPWAPTADPGVWLRSCFTHPLGVRRVNPSNHPFGERRNKTGGGYRMHSGHDLSVVRGTPIYAVMDGTVTISRSGISGLTSGRAGRSADLQYYEIKVNNSGVDDAGNKHAFSTAGNYIEINHGKDSAGNTYKTRYMHMIKDPVVNVGAVVAQGQLLGFVGNTGHSYGAHLHFEFKIAKKYKDPTDYITESSDWTTHPDLGTHGDMEQIYGEENSPQNKIYGY